MIKKEINKVIQHVYMILKNEDGMGCILNHAKRIVIPYTITIFTNIDCMYLFIFILSSLCAFHIMEMTYNIDKRMEIE